MKYLKVLWIHKHEDEPVILYSELDEDNYEVRKIDVYRNNKMYFASKNEYSNNIMLSECQIPTINEIETQSTKKDKFKAFEINKDEFEKVWKKAKKILST